MNKCLLALGLLGSLIFSGVGRAGTSGMPIWVTPPRGATVKLVAHQHHLTIEQLLRLNKGVQMRPGHELLPGEQLNVNPKTDPEWLGLTVWQYIGADVFGPSLVPLLKAGRIDSLNTVLRATALSVVDSLLPDAAAERMRTQVEIQDPKIVQVFSSSDSMLVLDNLIFGGYETHKNKHGKLVRSKVKVWQHGVICLWKKAGTSQRLPLQYAAVWDPIRVPGLNREYQLLVFLECRNGATMSYDVAPEPVIEVVPEPTREVIPHSRSEEVYVEPPVVQPPPLVTTPPVTPVNQYYTDCVWWLTGEHFRIDPNGKPYAERHGENLFLGHEHTYWSSLRKATGLRYRTAEARFNLWSSNSRAGDYNLGLVWAPLSKRNFRIDLEGGMWYSAAERGYYQVTEPIPGRWEWHPKKVTVDGFGPYVRSQLILPLNGYADYKFRTGKLLSEHGGFITFRPGWLFLKAGSNLQVRNRAIRHINPDIMFPADTMSMSEVRAGIIWSKWFLTYGSWNHWEYSSNSYDFTRFGPGGGFEWNFLGTTSWRLDGDVIRFKDFDDGIWFDNDVLTHHRSVNREWRFKLGLVYSPATMMHSKKH